MNEILIDFGVFQISWYSVCILIGIFVGGFLILKEGKKFNVNPDFITNLVFWMVFLGVVGSRIYYVAFNWDYYTVNLLSILKIWEGGLAIHGAIILGILTLIIYAKKYKVKILVLCDIFSVGVIIGQAIGRWGNFFNQEAHGPEVSRTFLEGLYLPNFIIEGMNIYGIYYHPTFLYESLWCFLGFIILLLIRRYKYLKIGQLTGTYFMWYSVGRFFIEALRTDSLMIENLKAAQIVSVIMFLIGLVLVLIKNKGSRFENLYRKGEIIGGIRF